MRRVTCPIRRNHWVRKERKTGRQRPFLGVCRFASCGTDGVTDERKLLVYAARPVRPVAPYLLPRANGSGGIFIVGRHKAFHSCSTEGRRQPLICCPCMAAKWLMHAMKLGNSKP